MLPLSAKDRKNVSALANSHIHSMPSCFIASNKWDARNYISLIVHLALVANGKQETLDEWNGLFTRHELTLRIEKTEALHIGHQREELDIELVGNKLSQGDSFVYLVGAVCGVGKTERGVRRKVHVCRSERVESS